MTSAPDIVSKIREALEGAGACITVHSERLGDTLDNEGNNEPQFACEATYACDKILEALALLPQLSVMLAKEPVSADLDTLRMVRGALKNRTRRYIQEIIDALITRMEHAPETPTAVVANWMIENGYITGHGDTVADLLNELVEQARMEQNTVPDINKCPKCGGAADNGHDREVPPNPYYCTKCTQKQNTGSDVAEDASTRKDEAVGVIAATTSEIRDTSSASYAAGQSERHCEAASAPQITNPVTHSILHVG